MNTNCNATQKKVSFAEKAAIRKRAMRPVKGHSFVLLERTGCENSYVWATCQCGQWKSNLWTSRLEAVKEEHRSHKRDVLRSLKETA